MQLDSTSLVPLYQQIADNLRAGILDGTYPEGTQIPSTTQISRDEQMNPATVLKGVNQLVDAGLVEKRRGLGMFVTTGAAEKVKAVKRQAFVTVQLQQLIKDAKRLDIDLNTLTTAIKEAYNHEQD
ncbi:GntR family transcriptional regulator [Lacticaseibacillus pabuli]|uniref:GntR family transcriptional regulator n=1 Tax=Lacticaseibacillus pabuli TaxID=3025672 RepID=A0ABY7WTH6_9LACO|nr:GntR family transcriptional regulator [Lacticaseibacillus sp. KACC 23028]WDF83416.1 GntR family transcriptional regulator [Lacticaseibacillus sp. KACC 23028]